MNLKNKSVFLNNHFLVHIHRRLVLHLMMNTAHFNNVGPNMLILIE